MTTKEPFLDDQRIVFQQNFSLVDTTMNSAEVQYYHLRIPKTKLTDAPLHATEPSIAPLPSENQQKKGKLIDNSVLAPKEKILNKIQKEEEEEVAKVPKAPSARPRQRVQQQPQQDDNSQKEPAPQQRTRPKPASPVAQKQEPAKEEPPKPNTSPASKSPTKTFKETTNLRTLNDFWAKPLKNGESIAFQVAINDNEFTYIASDTGEILLHATKTDTGFDIYNGDKKEFEIKAQNDSSSFIVTSNERPSHELAAMTLNQSFTRDDQPRLFDIYIPALKKKDGQHQVLKIDAAETSGLIARVAQKAKEAISMSTRVPPNTGNSFDLCQEGLFKKPDKHNYIIYHQSQPKRIVSSLGLAESNLFRGTATYPMCPIQAFFAALATHLKD